MSDAASPIAPTCPGCAVAEALARERPGRVVACDDCKADCYVEPSAPAPRPRARPLAPLPPPDPVERDRNAAPETWRAERDLASLARHPFIRGMNLEPTHAVERAAEEQRALAALEDETPEQRDARQERDVYRAHHVRHRLAAMRAPTRKYPVLDDDGKQTRALGPDGAPTDALAWREEPSPHGPRYADIVWHWYGVLGPEARADALEAERVGRRFGAQAEREAFRARWVAEHPKMLPKQVNALVPGAYGNALLGAAIAAYERDEWTAVAPPLPPREPKAREKFAARVAEAWAAAAARLGLGDDPEGA